MAIINLRDYYPFYTSDCFMEVSEEVAEMFKEFDRKEAAYRLRTYRHKAYYSLDRDDGLEHEAVFVALSPHELYERKVTMQEKFKDFQILHGREEKVNPKLTAYQVELAQVEAEIEKLLDMLTGANATLLAYANKKIEELDTRRQTISKAIAELSVETISPQQIKKLSYYLDNWDSIDFDDKRKAADGLISTIKATSDRVQIEWKI